MMHCESFTSSAEHSREPRIDFHNAVSRFRQPRSHATFVSTLCRGGRVQGRIAHQPQEDTTMSTAPLSVRLFRFLAVVASAPFIVLMLGALSNADQLTSVSLSPAFASKSLRFQFNHLRRLAQVPITPEERCNMCRELYLDNCFRDCRSEPPADQNACFVQCRVNFANMCFPPCK